MVPEQWSLRRRSERKGGFRRRHPEFWPQPPARYAISCEYSNVSSFFEPPESYHSTNSPWPLFTHVKHELPLKKTSHNPCWYWTLECKGDVASTPLKNVDTKSLTTWISFGQDLSTFVSDMPASHNQDVSTLNHTVAMTLKFLSPRTSALFHLSVGSWLGGKLKSDA